MSEDERIKTEGTVRRLIDANIKSATMACLWCLRTQIIKKCSLAFHHWKMNTKLFASMESSSRQLESSMNESILSTRSIASNSSTAFGAFNSSRYASDDYNHNLDEKRRALLAYADQIIRQTSVSSLNTRVKTSTSHRLRNSRRRTSSRSNIYELGASSLNLSKTITASAATASAISADVGSDSDSVYYSQQGPAGSTSLSLSAATVSVPSVADGHAPEGADTSNGYSAIASPAGNMIGNIENECINLNTTTHSARSNGGGETGADSVSPYPFFSPNSKEYRGHVHPTDQKPPSRRLSYKGPKYQMPTVSSLVNAGSVSGNNSPSSSPILDIGPIGCIPNASSSLTAYNNNSGSSRPPKSASTVGTRGSVGVVIAKGSNNSNQSERAQHGSDEPSVKVNERPHNRGAATLTSDNTNDEEEVDEEEAYEDPQVAPFVNSASPGELSLYGIEKAAHALRQSRSLSAHFRGTSGNNIGRGSSARCGGRGGVEPNISVVCPNPSLLAGAGAPEATGMLDTSDTSPMMAVTGVSIRATAQSHMKTLQTTTAVATARGSFNSLEGVQWAGSRGQALDENSPLSAAAVHLSSQLDDESNPEHKTTSTSAARGVKASHLSHLAPTLIPPDQFVGRMIKNTTRDPFISAAAAATSSGTANNNNKRSDNKYNGFSGQYPDPVAHSVSLAALSQEQRFSYDHTAILVDSASTAATLYSSSNSARAPRVPSYMRSTYTSTIRQPATQNRISTMLEQEIRQRARYGGGIRSNNNDYNGNNNINTNQSFNNSVNIVDGRARKSQDYPVPTEASSMTRGRSTGTDGTGTSIRARSVPALTSGRNNNNAVAKQEDSAGPNPNLQLQRGLSRREGFDAKFAVRYPDHPRSLSELGALATATGGALNAGSFSSSISATGAVAGANSSGRARSREEGSSSREMPRWTRRSPLSTQGVRTALLEELAQLA